MHVTAPATPRELFDLWAEVHPQDLPPPALVRHPHVAARLPRLRASAPDLFQVEEVGLSVEGRSLNLVHFGHGPRHVLLWSQMHGDEPTATTALFDLFEYVLRHREHPRVARLLSALTLHALPMLNPDGVERFQRRNAQGIDINRDALALQTPEGRTLKAVRDRLQPSLGFNLHNQSWRTAVGGTGKPASISLLAPPFDAARSDNPGRVLAKKVCAVIRDALEPLAPGQLGRYDDSFEVRAFGDNLGRWGTPTVLIETGPWPSPEPDEPLLRLNFVALVSALEALASGAVEHADVARYESLPFNDSKGLLHLVIRGAHIFGDAGDAFLADVGVAAALALRERKGASPTVVLTGTLEELGDLRVLGAVEEVDGTGLTVVPLPPAHIKEGDTLPLPPRSELALRPGLPAELVLLRPVKSAGPYRVERIIRYER
ncbi:M14 metallopeptidase family protein [Archangium sp.]|uniref:M14 family metallopeptidase n=1 Tax=Archangium sp. TaxID=1872627 RepID=UPI002EDAB072